MKDSIVVFAAALALCAVFLFILPGDEPIVELIAIILSLAGGLLIFVAMVIRDD